MADLINGLNTYMSQGLNYINNEKQTVSTAKSTETLFTSDTHKHNIHPLEKLADQVLALEKKPKMLGVMLKLNDSKTELMFVTSKRTKHLHSLPTSITIGNAQIPFKKSVKNLGFTLDCHLTMNAHVSNIARTCYFVMRRLESICRFLTSTATATHVSAFVLSRIDYCNSLLFGSTHNVTSHLQRIQNYAARVILRLPKSSSITIHLKSLHWLPVKVRSTYKIACLCYHCHSSTAPSYVTGMLHRKPLHTRNTRSSSYTMHLLNRPAHSKATLGDRSFSFASSSVWNSIPNDVRCAPSLSSFKSRLKT